MSEGAYRDISSKVSDFTGDSLYPENLARLVDLDLKQYPMVRLGTMVTGVGLSFNPPRYLKSGDIVEIKGLGKQQQHVIDDME